MFINFTASLFHYSNSRCIRASGVGQSCLVSPRRLQQNISKPAGFGPAVLWYFKYCQYYKYCTYSKYSRYFNSSLPSAVVWYCTAEEFQLSGPTTAAWALPSLPTAALQWPPLDIREGQPTESWPFGRNNWAVRQLTNQYLISRQFLLRTPKTCLWDSWAEEEMQSTKNVS